MKIFPTDRQRAIMKDLRIKDAGKNHAAFGNFENGEMSVSDIDVLCDVINAEFMVEGMLPNFEPNEYGLELERLIDVLNGPGLRRSV
jgi:hypothetical protein